METEVRPEWLTYTEAERLTGLSRVTLWRLINAQNGIKVARVGRSVRISRKGLEEFMEQATTK